MAGSRPTLVHCTNGYPMGGDDPEQVLEALTGVLLPWKAAASGDAALGIGLYLPAPAAEQIVHRDAAVRFVSRIRRLGVEVLTLNGFPFGRFFQRGDPRRVYAPAWDDRRRMEQTLHLATLLASWVPPGTRTASISTLPVGWSAAGVDVERAADHLKAVAAALRVLRDRSGVEVTVDLEPEPGCVLGDSRSAVRFFEEHLADPADREVIGVCHDVCHAAVMFEEQAEALGRYRDAGVRVHKVQLSNAPEVVFEGMNEPLMDEAVGLLRTLPGDRSLRQTSVRGDRSGFFDDLDDALVAHPQPGGRWRVHHHLPLTLDAIGPLRPLRDEIAEALAALAAHGETPILETETYTWSALPPALRARSLAEGLAAELAWAEAEIDRAWSA